ncbi:MAG: transposase [Planctomycetota bacterium]|nr:transposase [Planctomycetota bacterium]
MAEDALEAARLTCERTSKPARHLKELTNRPEESWSRSRRVAAKAEERVGRANPRLLMTSLDEKEWPAAQLYEGLSCARGEMESGIKEQRLDLLADRTCCWSRRARQTRLYLSSMPSCW